MGELLSHLASLGIARLRVEVPPALGRRNET